MVALSGALVALIKLSGNPIFLSFANVDEPLVTDDDCAFDDDTADDDIIVEWGMGGVETLAIID